MLLEAKISDPVCIRLGKDSNFIMADENNKEAHPLVPGAMFGGEHYGFVLIVDYNGKQREIVYPTQCRIDAVGIEGGHLKLFEEGKKFAWRFSSFKITLSSGFLAILILIGFFKVGSPINIS